MIKIFTSNFARSSRQPGAISIARFAPYFWGNRPSYPALAPSPAMLQMSGDEYDQHFNRQLEQLNARQVISELAEFARDGQIVLLCHESPNIRCHRRRVAQWLQSDAGVVVPELGFPDVLPYELLPPKATRAAKPPALPLFDDVHIKPFDAPKNERPRPLRRKR